MMTIFDEATLHKLEQLTLTADKVRIGQMKGDRRSKKRGTSIEFADYRNYTKGDDLRRLDWNVYARLERPFIKLLEEEEDLAVHLLLDGSASMNWPNHEEDDESNKFRYAARLTGALGYIGLSTGDMVTTTLIQSAGDRAWGPFRGQQNALRLFQFLQSGVPEGMTDLNLSLRNYALYGRRPGLLFLITDLLTPHGYLEGVTALQARGYEIGIIHLLSPDEVEPPITGDLKLIDVETGSDAELTLDPATLDLYRDRLRNWQTEIANTCANRQIHYIPITTDEPWDRIIQRTMRAKGIVK